MTRVYVPTTLPLLREYVAGGVVPAGAERVLAASEDEDDEYAALTLAADASAAKLRGPGRRVVLVAETGAETGAGTGAGTGGDGPIPLADLVAVHTDTDDVDPHDPDPPELAWYATQELPDLIRP